MRNSTVILLFAALAVVIEASPRAAAFDASSSYKRESCQGVTILINPEVLKHAAEAAEMRKELESQLAAIARVVPAGPRSALKNVWIWVEWEKKKNGAAEFHPSAEWLKQNGYNPEKAGHIELSNTRNFVRWSRDAQPWMVLHELAHAYHHLVLGENHAGIEAAYKQAVDRKLYDSVAYCKGGKQRAYALTNAKEYFAELSEAYFGRNDFFPFTHDELKRHDPAGFRLMEEVWGRPCDEASVQIEAVAEDAARAMRRRKTATIDLNGTWRVRPEPLACIGESGLIKMRQAKDGWIAAEVPGEIHLDLIRAGQMPEPTVGANMPKCRWPETKSWWYENLFSVSEEFVKNERQQLVFDGLDLYAQVFLNGKLLGEATNAFVPARFDVNRVLRAGKNELIVRLTAGSELSPDDSPPGQGLPPHKPAFGEIPNPIREGDPYSHRNWYGRRWLRKPQAEYGWDWQDSLPNIGIWRGVRLEGRSHAVLDDLRLDTLLKDGRVSLEMEAVVENLHPWSERACALQLSIRPPDGGPAIERRYALDAVPGRSPVRDVIEIPQAKLWWPNGMGDQPLYQVSAAVVDASGIVRDERQFNIGLRTIDIDRRRLKEGSRFCVRVNGRDVFCRGANLGPHDVILARVSDAKYERLVAEAKNANMTMFRINGVSVFEGPAFYDACDRAGILVYHDFPFTCTTYPDDDPRFREAVRVETEAALRLLRHHPSIALWSGSNECLMGLCDWWNGDRSKPLNLGGSRLYNQVLPDVCRLFDPRRPYWPGSPCGGDNPNSDLAGDCHWWWAYLGDVNRRVRHEVFDECRGRFVSEWGFPAPPHLDSMREYLSPDEMKPDAWATKLHTNQMVWNTLDVGIATHYADPKGLSLPDYVRYAQMCQAFVHGHAMESMRFRKNDPADDCQGALIWSYSEPWGEVGWSLLDYYLRRKPSYYWVRRACQPVKVIVRRRGDRLVTRMVNDTLQPVDGEVEYGWWRLDGTQRSVQTRPVAVPADGMLEIASESVPSPKDRDPGKWLYAAVFRKDGAAVDQSIWLLEPYRKLSVPAGKISVTAVPGNCLEISSPVFAHGVHTEDHGREVISDNWLDLLPGVPVRVRLSPGVKPESVRLEAVMPR
jgi:beta-mannosidase